MWTHTMMGVSTYTLWTCFLSVKWNNNATILIELLWGLNACLANFNNWWKFYFYYYHTRPAPRLRGCLSCLFTPTLHLLLQGAGKRSLWKGSPWGSDYRVGCGKGGCSTVLTCSLHRPKDTSRAQIRAVEPASPDQIHSLLQNSFDQ